MKKIIIPLRQITCTLALGLLAGCAASNESVDIGDLVEKQKNGIDVENYNEIKDLIVDVAKDLTGEDVSDIVVHIMEREKLRKEWATGPAIAGIYHPHRGIYARKGRVYQVLGTVFHELGHYFTKHAEKDPNYGSLDLRKGFGFKREFTRQDLETKLMEESGALTFERLGMLAARRKYKKLGELGTDELLMGPTYEIDFYAVGDEICNDIYMRLLKKEMIEKGKVDELEVMKKTFYFVAGKDYNQIKWELTPRTRERAETLFRICQNIWAKANFAPKLYINPGDAMLGRYAPQLKGMFRPIVSASGKLNKESYIGNEDPEGSKLADRLELKEEKDTLVIVNADATHIKAIGDALQKKGYNVYFFAEPSYVKSYKEFMDEPTLYENFFQFFSVLYNEPFIQKINPDNPNAIVYGSDSSRDFDCRNYLPTLWNLNEKGVSKIIYASSTENKHLADYVGFLQRAGIKVERLNLK